MKTKLEKIRDDMERIKMITLVPLLLGAISDIEEHFRTQKNMTEQEYIDILTMRMKIHK